jgi:hypothetical protein
MATAIVLCAQRLKLRLVGLALCLAAPWQMAAASTYVEARANAVVDRKPLNAFNEAVVFGNTPIGSASASASRDKKAANATMNMGSSSLAGVTPSQFGNVLQGRIGGSDFIGSGGVYREVSSSALHVDRLWRPSGVSSIFATAGVFFDRSISATLRADASVISAYITGFASERGIANPNTTLELRLGSLLVESAFEVRFTDRTDGNNNALFSVYSQRTADLWVSTTLDSLAAGNVSNNLVERALNGTSVSVFDVSGDSFVQNDVDVPVADPLVASSAYVSSLPFFLRAGRSYDVEIQLRCRIGVSDAAAFMPGTGGICDADQSGYWNGFVAATDEQGNAIAVPDFESESGFNYRLASPLSPAQPIPEPSTWALLAAGLGMVGVVVRRRRAA